MADWYCAAATCTPDPVENPVGTRAGEQRIMRRGSWANCPVFLRGASRVGSYPGASGYIFGFRCARDS